jgi:hypothetical protein
MKKPSFEEKMKLPLTPLGTKEINQEKEKEKKNLWTKDMTDVKTTEWEGNKPGRRRKKNLRTKDMTDVKTSIYLWTKDVTNIRCHVWCY